jgi:hypothetical protein
VDSRSGTPPHQRGVAPAAARTAAPALRPDANPFAPLQQWEPAESTEATPMHYPSATLPHCGDVLGTWNLNGLTGSHAVAKLAAVTALMDAHGVGVLAVQQTRVMQAAQIPTMLLQCGATHLKFMGEPATLTDKGNPTGGAGFFVHSDLLDRVTYRGILGTAVRFRPPWLTLKGATPDDSLHIGSVYLPDASIFRAATTKHLFTDAMCA